MQAAKLSCVGASSGTFLLLPTLRTLGLDLLSLVDFPRAPCRLSLERYGQGLGVTIILAETSSGAPVTESVFSYSCTRERGSSTHPLGAGQASHTD